MVSIYFSPLIFAFAQGLNERKNLPQDTIMLLLNNVATYLNCISLESSLPTWTVILTHFDNFLRRLPSVLPNPCDAGPIFKIMITLLKVHVIGSVRVSVNVTLNFFTQSEHLAPSPFCIYIISILIL